ncbi:MAG TPA: hypothetical protein VM553_16850 [Dongiaceae bacterium]|nr:hypothetical protein [Dongiaceae bacterium]
MDRSGDDLIMLREASHNFSGAMGLLSSGYRDTAVRDRMLSETYSQDDIRNGFRAEIRSPRTAFSERVKMALATLFAVALPLAFVVLVASSCVVWIQFTIDMLQQGASGRPAWASAVVAGDLFLLGFLAAMVRRLVLIRRNARQYRSLSIQAQPELHAFVNHVALLLRVPFPRAIKLDAEVGLILRPGSLKDILLGHGPEILIGVPLLYGLSARQLAGVIAHAYAGYTSEARRFGYPLICAIDRWLFAQSGLARSATTIKEEFRSLDSEGRSSRQLAALLKPFDFLVQSTFYLLYRIISAVTFVVSRRIDMVGDQFSSRIAGSTEFRSTQFRLRSLHYGQQHANRELLKSWRNSRLSSNFPCLVVDHADTLQLSLRPRLIQEMEELVTPLTRSRIVDLGRIVNVEHYQDEGACFLLGPAISLLRDADGIARTVSLGHYQALGIREPELMDTQRMPVPVPGEREKANRNEVFVGLERTGRVLRVDDFDIHVGRSEQERSAELEGLIEKIRHDAAVIHHLADTYRNFDSRKNLLHTRKVIEEALGKDEARVRDIEVQWLGLIKEQSEVKAELVQYEALLARRIGIVLSLTVERPEIREQLTLGGEELRSHILRVTDALSFLGRAHESLQRLRAYTHILGQLMVHASTEDEEDIGPRQDELAERYKKYVLLELGSVLGAVNNVPHPMLVYALNAVEASNPAAASPSYQSIGQAIQLEVRDLDSASSCPEACHRVATSVIHYIESLNEQLQERLSLLVSRTEALYGLKAMADARAVYSR